MQGLALVGQLLEAWLRLVGRVYHHCMLGDNQIIHYVLFLHTAIHMLLSYVIVLHSLRLMCSCSWFAPLGWLRSHLGLVKCELLISMHVSVLIPTKRLPL